jgi:hypothetical protein
MVAAIVAACGGFSIVFSWNNYAYDNSSYRNHTYFIKNTLPCQAIAPLPHHELSCVFLDGMLDD